MSATIPKVRFKSNKATPWFDSDLRHLHHVKITSWRKARRTKKPSDSAKFKQLRNQFKKKLSNKYNNVVNDLSDNIITNPKRFWTFFKKKTKAKSFPENIFHGSQECSSPRKKANLFSSISNLISLMMILLLIHIVLSLLEFSQEGIAKMLHELNVNETCGPDSLSSHVLEECATELAPSLAHLFTRSF